MRRWFYARLGNGRFVEKTPENAMRIPYLLELFPDAHLLWVKRDPAASVRSMLEGWQDPGGAFRSYYLPEVFHIPGQAASRRWSFGLIEGWRDLVRSAAPLPTIVAEQWRQHVGGALAGRELVEPGHWHELRLEELVADPTSESERLQVELGLPVAPSVLDLAAGLPSRRHNALVSSAAGRHVDEADVAAALELLRPEIAASGYA